MILGFLEGKYEVDSFIGNFLDMCSGGWLFEALTLVPLGFSLSLNKISDTPLRIRSRPPPSKSLPVQYSYSSHHT
jgi:hypothetical protein